MGDELDPTRPTDLIPREMPGRTDRATGWLRSYELMARDVAQAIILPDAIRGDPRAVLAVALTGREMGLGFMESIRHIHIIKGVPTVSAELKVRKVREAGHDIEVLARDDTRIRLRGTRKDTGKAHEVEWTTTGQGCSDDASTVPHDLLNKSNWKQYPQQMLWARTASQLVREHFPDVMGASLYSTEEIPGDE